MFGKFNFVNKETKISIKFPLTDSNRSRFRNKDVHMVFQSGRAVVLADPGLIPDSVDSGL